MLKYSEHRLSKRLGLLLFACMFLVALGYAHNASAVVRMSAGVTYQTGGYDLLSRYGEWMRVRPYGVVWCPYVDASWAPFYDGRWMWTSGGWAWDSYEPFGDIVYHYGYWYNEPGIGWFWVPGDEWSPARVQWYTHGSYCGWAPLSPPNYYWPDPWDSYGFNIWVVVHINNFCDDHIGYRGIDRPRYRDAFRRDSVVKRAPDIKQVKTLTRREIPVNTITRRPMDIRTDKIEIAARSETPRNVEAQRAVPAQRDIADNGRIAPVTQRRVAIPRNDATAKRVVAAPKRNAQVERTAAPPARSAQPEQSRTVEKRSDGATVKKVKR